MKVNYHLADFVSKMNLAVKGRYSRVIVFRTKFILNLIKVLQRNGFIERFVLHERYISIYLKFFKSRCVFSYIELISRPGKRQY
jgi:Ribosomal protein S8